MTDSGTVGERLLLREERADEAASVRAVVEGSLLANYDYRRYKTGEDPAPPLRSMTVVESEPERAEAARGASEQGVAAAEATMLARDLATGPANLVTPTFDFADRDLIYLAYPDVVVDPDVYRERMGRIAYEYRSERTSLRLQPYYRRQDYFDDAVDDQERRGIAFNVDYRLRPLLTLSFLAGYEKRDFDDMDRVDKDSVFNIGLEDQFTRHWIGRIDVRYAERDSNFPDRSYEANSVMLTVVYRR